MLQGQFLNGKSKTVNLSWEYSAEVKGSHIMCKALDLTPSVGDKRENGKFYVMHTLYKNKVTKGKYYSGSLIYTHNVCVYI